MAEYEPLTLEASAAIGAFMHQLTIQAEGGQPVDEETLALRMLASVNGASDSDLSDIRPLSADNAPVTADAGGNDKFDKLVSLMMGDTQPTAEQVAQGQVPMPPPIALLPAFTDDRILANYDTLMDAQSMVQLYSRLMQVQQKPDGFDITTEAPMAFNFQAKAAYDAMMGPLAGFYNFGLGSMQTYSNTIPRGDIHGNLLGKIFDNFGFDPDTINKLDGQLTNFVAGLAGVNTDNNPTNTIDFCQIFGLCPGRNLVGDGKPEHMIYQPTTFMIYLKIDAHSFRQSLGKDSSIDKVDFNFSMIVTRCELNVSKFNQCKDKFDKIFQFLTQKNLRAYSQLANKQIKTNEANPGGSK